MKLRPSSLTLAVLASAFSPLHARADNPFVQTIYTADPAPLVHDGRVYIYTGHDEDRLINDFFTMNDWRVYSSVDMVNWTDHGSPLRISAFSWASGDAWAGQVIRRNGKFYFYVTVSRKSGGRTIGVAVSDSPTGPFIDPLGRPLITNPGEIDPTVFIDDDGQAYLYWGNPNLWYVKLNQDMISYQGSVVQVPLTTGGFGVRSGDPNRTTLFEEAPWFYKRNGVYYLVYAAGGIPEHIAYSTSRSPTGPWTYGGVVMPTQGTSFTNHPGVIDYEGRSYFVYHNGALPGGGGFHRSVAIEQFSYNPDGTFPRIAMTTAGPAGVGTLNPYLKTEAETIAWASGVETEACAEGGMDVASIENGDTIKVKAVDFQSGATSFEARVASATTGGSIELRLGGPTGTLIGTCAVAGTGGWQTWDTRSCAVNGAAGVHDLYLRFTGGSGLLFNLNWWRFSAPEVDAGAPGGDGSAGSGGSAGMGTGGGAAAGGTAGAAATGGIASGSNPTGGTVSGAGGASSAGGFNGGGIAEQAVAPIQQGGQGGCSCGIRRAPRGAGTSALALTVLGLSTVHRRRESLKRRPPNRQTRK